MNSISQSRSRWLGLVLPLVSCSWSKCSAPCGGGVQYNQFDQPVDCNIEDCAIYDAQGLDDPFMESEPGAHWYGFGTETWLTRIELSYDGPGYLVTGRNGDHHGISQDFNCVQLSPYNSKKEEFLKKI